MNVKKSLILLLVAISGFFLLHSHLNYQPLLAQGDHGRDLYAFQAVMNGKLPYRDFWWVYGPLMPYYYSLFLKVFGIGIKSVLIGKLLLNLLSGVFVFLSLSLFIPRLFAYMAALWFWTFQPDFFFTYNHAGGITMLMAATYAIFLYLRNSRVKYLYWALSSIFLLSLIKINFGLIALLTFLIILYMSDRINKIPFSSHKRLFCVTATTLFPLLLFLIYFFLTRDLPLYAIRQCFPYLGSDHPHNASLVSTLNMWWQATALNVNANWPNRFFGFLLMTSIFLTLRELFHHKPERTVKQKMILAISILGILYTANLHEFLASGVLYRTFWAKPFSILLVFLFIGFALRDFPKVIQALLISTLFLIIFLKYTDQVEMIKARGDRGQYLSFDKGHIITNNSIQWVNTVKQATTYFKTHLKDNETFLSMPYDPLYYFLSGKTSPTRQLIFFEHINIPEEQEKKIIAELESKNINYVLLSSRMNSREPGLGIFGETYCPLLGEYITNHFRKVAEFGDWKNPPGWAWNHGVQIFKKTTRQIYEYTQPGIANDS